ncbi:hypothetical protein F4556_000675 [Kitasatospora gansuensis]|uniref:Uncharacterized protein n=1 Tax=Kitasatospora gansuensis TaxID=258050 RepID=A0A7W7S751_9ACTN|nr:hypothetical protein [Kitasatospora gansuensis]MBB4945140.1 hypothetical protein [Kitasatospora gansuensis]
MTDARAWLRTNNGVLLRADRIIAVQVAQGRLEVMIDGPDQYAHRHEVAHGDSEQWIADAPAELVATLERVRTGLTPDLTAIVVTVTDETPDSTVVHFEQTRHHLDGSSDSPEL